MTSDGYLFNPYGGAGGIGGLLMVRLNNMNYRVGQDGSGNILNLVNMSVSVRTLDPLCSVA